MTVHPVERQDIHKSCRTIETLLVVLNDYCETASAFAAIQKKLVKALRDTAALKTNAKFAVNAFGASSSIFEVLADVDSKFVKLADKESHAISAEVKKWLKKLARDEKAHDERMDESNARVKQAGQAYEKKSKKGAKDAGEEHARYIDLLSVIGPEMSQEKYNHAVHVTQQNTLITFNVAATLARIADAEWTRICECMRRVSPTIGSLGEWRSLCEGAWTGSLPDDLPDMSTETLPTRAPITPAVSEWGQNGLSTPVRRLLPVPPSHSPGSVSATSTASLDPPRSPFSTTAQSQGSINSITTLSAFPFPPTHFPVPLAMNEAEFQQQQVQLQSLQSARSRASSPSFTQANGVLAPPAPILSDSPKRMAAAELPESLPPDVPRSSHSFQASPVPSPSHQSTLVTRAPDEPHGHELLAEEDTETIRPKVSAGDPKKPRRPSLIALVHPPSDKPVRPTSPFKKAEHSSTDREFGSQTDGSKSAFKSHSIDVAKKNLERTDSTHSAGGNVAALRNKYTRTVESSSQGPKDVPRLPMSVSEIASRYQPVDEPMSPRRTASPIMDRLPPDTPSRRDLHIDENDVRRRRQRIEEMTDLELKEKEHRQREREHLQFLHSTSGSGSDTPKGPRNSPFQHKRGSRSVTHINVSSSTSSSGLVPTMSRPSMLHLPARSPFLPPKDHAPFCGCDSCSVSKYKAADAPPSPHDLRPPEPPILLRPEKPKGWIRRLSMPSVNVAFSLDAKKSAGAISLKAGLPFPGENGRLRKRSYERGISNRTMTGLGR